MLLHGYVLEVVAKQKRSFMGSYVVESRDQAAKLIYMYDICMGSMLLTLLPNRHVYACYALAVLSGQKRTLVDS